MARLIAISGGDARRFNADGRQSVSEKEQPSPESRGLIGKA
jgi:hypothetical protein